MVRCSAREAEPSEFLTERKVAQIAPSFAYSSERVAICALLQLASVLFSPREFVSRHLDAPHLDRFAADVDVVHFHYDVHHHY